MPLNSFWWKNSCKMLQEPVELNFPQFRHLRFFKTRKSMLIKVSFFSIRASINKTNKSLTQILLIFPHVLVKTDFIHWRTKLTYQMYRVNTQYLIFSLKVCYCHNLLYVLPKQAHCHNYNSWLTILSNVDD